MSLVFISYAREDGDSALRLYRDLRKAELEPWIDKEDLLGGQDWQSAVGEAIRSSSYFLALISKHSVPKRGYVQREIHDALEVYRQVPPGQIYLVPVRLDKTEPLHRELKDLQWVDLFPSYSQGLRRLLKSFKVDDGRIAMLMASIDESRPISAPANEAAPVPQYRYPRVFPDGFSTTAPEMDSSDECTYDENGVCTNQKHWGANE